MPIEARCSKYRRTNLKFYIGLFVVLALWFGYDGYFSTSFKEKHVDRDGKPDNTLVFNQKSPPVFLAAVVLLGGYFAVVRNKKIVADENELVISEKEKIPYDTIQKIDKTFFDKKGFFVLTYTDKNGSQINRKISSRKYDNLRAVLDHLVVKIS